jgi:hypothetical protein
MLVPTVGELSIVRNLLHGKDLNLLRPACQSELEGVLAEVRSVLDRRQSRLDSVDRALLTAICILTGGMVFEDYDLLPHSEALAGLVGAVPGDRVRERRRIAVDCAIAYGCGWGRTPRVTRHFALDEFWESAVQLLTQQISDATEVGNDFLTGPLRPLLDDNEARMLQELKADHWVTGATLAFRLIRPLHSRVHAAGEICEIAANSEVSQDEVMADAPRLDFTRITAPAVKLHPLPAGARYVFDVESGTAVAVQESVMDCDDATIEWDPDIDSDIDSDAAPGTNGRVLAAGPGGRFVVLAGDFGATEVSFPVDADVARKLRLKRGGRIVVSAIGDSAALKVWECGCGSWACQERHRLSSWRPNPKIGLKDFVNSAINGRDYPLKPKSFIAGMYYAYLSREGWGGPKDLDSAPPPRIRRVLMVRETRPINPETHQPEIRQELRENFLLLSLTGNFRPQRVVRCGDCRLFQEWGGSKCECGAELPRTKPTVVWKPLPSANVDPFAAFRSYLARLLERWGHCIEEKECVQRKASACAESDAMQTLREERRFFRSVEDAYRRGDLVEAANLIRLARQKGFDLPEDDDDED